MYVTARIMMRFRHYNDIKCYYTATTCNYVLRCLEVVIRAISFIKGASRDDCMSCDLLFHRGQTPFSDLQLKLLTSSFTLQSNGNDQDKPAKYGLCTVNKGDISSAILQNGPRRAFTI